jgi:ParB family chromosome partitioning protein
MTSSKALPKKTKTRDLSKEALLGSLSGQLENVFGTKVAIREGGRHKGRIEIEYYSDEELDRIIELLQSVKN